jgi:hypothetical protein
MFEHVKVECTKGSFRIPIPKAVGVRTRGVNWLELSAGQSKVLRWDQAAAVFGFPQARDEGKRKNRTDMHRQLRLMWGFHEGYDSETEALKGQYSSWEAKRPNFRVTTLDGAYIPMVLDDPECGARRWCRLQHQGPDARQGARPDRGTARPGRRHRSLPADRHRRRVTAAAAR